jgi:hypothetical protein
MNCLLHNEKAVAVVVAVFSVDDLFDLTMMMVRLCSICYTMLMKKSSLTMYGTIP